jgi:hypothetical protein
VLDCEVEVRLRNIKEKGHSQQFSRLLKSENIDGKYIDSRQTAE